MNHERLGQLGDKVRKLKAIADNRASVHESVTSASALTTKPQEQPLIDTLDMRVLHARHRACTAGNLAGITIQLYPQNAVAMADEDERRHGRRPPPIPIAERILGLDSEFAHPLLSPPPRVNRYCMTTAEAATAIDRILAGESPDRIWNHTT